MGKKRVVAFAGIFVVLAAIYLLYVPPVNSNHKNVSPKAKAIDAALRAGVRHTPGFNVFNFVGMGDIALLFNAHSPDGGNLYTILNRGRESDLASFHFIADHVLWAKFSPDGRWLALERIASGATGLQRTLWLISANGEQRREVAAGARIPAGTWMPGGSTYLYGIHHLYSLRPLGSPHNLPLRFTGKATIQAIEFTPQGHTAAFLIREHTQGISGSYDEIGLWSKGEQSMRPLVVVAPPNGLVLGPFSADGQSLFYWPAPARAPGAASVSRSMLSVVTLGGQGATVAETPVLQRAIQPFGQSRALVLVAGSLPATRANLRLAIFQKGSLSMLPGNGNVVEQWPAINPQATQIVCVTAASSGGSRPVHGVHSLQGHLQLAVYNLGSANFHTISAAGVDVSMPVYDATGRRIVYIQNGNVMWISADGKGAPHFVAGPALWRGNSTAPPIAKQQSVVIADYLPTLYSDGKGQKHASNLQ
ncbi:MAG: TolB-like translocation protein [Bacilli bacterium]